MIKKNRIFYIKGGWTFAFFDYYDLNITQKVDSYGIFAMEKIIDPRCKTFKFFNIITSIKFINSFIFYQAYLDRYENIKLLVITTAGDEFFLGVR